MHRLQQIKSRFNTPFLTIPLADFDIIHIDLILKPPLFLFDSDLIPAHLALLHQPIRSESPVIAEELEKRQLSNVSRFSFSRKDEGRERKESSPVLETVLWRRDGR